MSFKLISKPTLMNNVYKYVKKQMLHKVYKTFEVLFLSLLLSRIHFSFSTLNIGYRFLYRLPCHYNFEHL